MRRLDPRGLDAALSGLLGELRPATPLAWVQEVWPRAVGEALSAEAQPLSERRGTVTVGCRSSVWAQELELMSSDLLERLNGALGQTGSVARVEALRFVATGPARRRARRR